MSDQPAPELPAKKNGRPPGRLQADHVRRTFKGGRLGFSPNEIKAALEANFFNPRIAAMWLIETDKKISKELGGIPRTITSGTIREFVDRRKLQLWVRDNAKTEILDLAEASAISLLKRGHAGITAMTLRSLGAERGYSGNDTIIILDPAQLTVDQLLQVLDPSRMSDEQINAVVEMFGRHFEFTPPPAPPNGHGPVIDHEPLMLQEPPDAAADQVPPL